MTMRWLDRAVRYWRPRAALAAVVLLARPLPRHAARQRCDRILPGEIVAGCCTGDDTYPEWVIAFAEANIETVRQLGLIQLRPAASCAIRPPARSPEGALQPLDLACSSTSDNRVSGLLIPGQFTHSAVYVGTEAQPGPGSGTCRRSSGATRSRRAPPISKRSTAGCVSRPPRWCSTPTRWPFCARSWIGAEACPGLARMGVLPTTCAFDAADGSELFCAELIDEMFLAAILPRTEVPGRETILIDAVVVGALADELPFGLVGYVRASADGSVRALSAQELARDIRRGWPDLTDRLPGSPAWPSDQCRACQSRKSTNTTRSAISVSRRASSPPDRVHSLREAARRFRRRGVVGFAAQHLHPVVGPGIAAPVAGTP
ncbi:MAG: hypothetical protein R3D59_12895 [Paracoccaceae bacterium]